jgi:hypothetical protein
MNYSCPSLSISVSIIARAGDTGIATLFADFGQRKSGAVN